MAMLLSGLTQVNINPAFLEKTIERFIGTSCPACSEETEGGVCPLPFRESRSSNESGIV